MNHSTSTEFAANYKTFLDAIQMMPVLEGIPLEEIRESDISLLQRLSIATKFDGLMILLSVDYHDKNLVAEYIFPDERARSKWTFKDCPDSAVFIGNAVSPEIVVTELQKIARRYLLLNAPPFRRYEDGDANVELHEFTRGNSEARYKHEIFMRDNGMHQTSIPTDYKQLNQNTYRE